jgi:hypothetical protein
MADREKEGAARNRDFIAQMAAPPTQAQLLAELQLEITDAVQLAVALNFPSVVRLLQMAKLEVNLLRQQRDTQK